MLKGLFGKSRFLEADLEDWIFETWAWLMRNLGGMEHLAQTPLIIPTPEFFPRTETEGHERAGFMLDCLKQTWGLMDWPTQLEAFDRQPANAQVGEFWNLAGGEAPNGLFQARDGLGWIGYASDLVAQPHRLTATLAHELSHYLLSSVAEPSPGGEDAHELATELCVAYFGGGVFAANTAFEFSQHGDSFSQGWRSSRNGYFSERTWAFALALFLSLKNEPIPDRWLKPGLTAMTQKAMRYLAGSPSLMAPLRGIG
ncbi:hypothetical protein [Phenylobacterium sp.]|uniref:hypothetical protein n=1 Tax=Phenylobacterium sp. TaxID=1871053 RepID=UPI0030F3B48D